ncbi:MAG: hypothetical protein OEZ13_03750 [Spirochaetia bacterium]|nr:hypothetical protein [Spirochaetia bacterium]
MKKIIIIILTALLSLPLYAEESESTEENIVQEEYEQPEGEYTQDDYNKDHSYIESEENQDYTAPDEEYQPDASENTDENR